MPISTINYINCAYQRQKSDKGFKFGDRCNCINIGVENVPTTQISNLHGEDTVNLIEEIQHEIIIKDPVTNPDSDNNDNGNNDIDNDHQNNNAEDDCKNNDVISVVVDDEAKADTDVIGVDSVEESNNQVNSLSAENQADEIEFPGNDNSDE